MKILGTSQNGHEFKCGANTGDCIFESTCSKSRTIAFDTGYFQPMPPFLESSQQAIDIRKNCERPFNLLTPRIFGPKFPD